MSLLDDVSLMITPNGVAEDILFGVLPTPTIGETLTINPTFDTSINIGTAGSGWQDESTGGSSASFSGGGGKLLSNGSDTVRLRAMTVTDATAVVVSGTTYKLTYDVIENNGVPANKFSYYNGSGTVQISETVGSYELYYTASGTVFQFQLSDSGMDNGDYIIVDNVYLKEYTTSDMSFTRATTATRVNSSSNIEDVPRNLLEYSEDLTNSFWNSVRVETIVASTIPSPDGATFGFKALPNTENNHHYVDYDYNDISLASTGSEVTYSVYVKPFGYTDFQLAPSTGFNSGSFVLYQNFELTGDGVKGTGNVNGATIEKIGDWYRCSITETATDTNLRVLNIPLPSSGLGRNPTFEGNATDGVLLWGGQIEKGTLATTYIPTTDRLNVPRLDYTGGGCPHILSEPQRTNTAFYSEDYTTQWINNSSLLTITPNATTSPDGTSNATKFLSTSDTTSVKCLLNNLSFTSGTTYTFSIYCKNIDSTIIKLLAYDGSTFQADLTSSVNTSTFTRISLTFTAANTTTSGQVQFAREIPDTESAFFWGAQVEEGSYATSYIPTTSASVTRNGEVFERTGVGDLINSSEGVLFIEMAALADDGTHRQISLTDGTNDNRISIGLSNISGNLTAQVVSGGTSQANKAKTATQTNYNKIALKWKVNDMALWLNGSEVDTDSSVTVPIGLDTLDFNRGDDANWFFGKVRQIQVYKTALSDTQLGALTT
tara:strand:- start:260 stop:2407 length:2148 start_codon:yes stop_codon:yes gene_type:complete